MIEIRDLKNEQMNELSLRQINHLIGGTIDPVDALYLALVEGVRRLM